ILQDLVTSVRVILGASFIGAYLQGSFAVGDFDAHSDVDFIIVTTGALAKTNVQALQAMHGRIYDRDIPWAQHLEGSYFPQDILRSCAQAGRPLWYLDHGSRGLIQSDHCNTVVVRWVVREKGVTLAGPPPAALVDPVPVEVLRADILATIRDWGSEILAEPNRFNNRFYQSFIVLSYCRMLHDLQRGAVGSKQAGAAWAKANLDPAWHGLIERTWAARPDPARTVRQPADPTDFEATLAFVRHIIRESARFSPG
ncbi:MAG: DUF4111 domain-containing protein, partial [Anaerolineae bacterium]|nr:DUF4111 domain-containing protein [Anaerolineae bacterium]